MSDNSELEKLLEFLYVAPIALIEFDHEGAVKMANPRVAQVFNRYAPGGYFQNFFTFAEEFLPELAHEIKSFSDERGQIMENKRYGLEAPNGDSEEQLWIDVSVIRQEKDRYFVSFNNVTNQVKIERQKFITEQRLDKFVESVNQHIFFTLNDKGVVDSWNKTGEAFIASENIAKGKLMSQLLAIKPNENSDILVSAQSSGPKISNITFNGRDGNHYDAQMNISSISDPQGKHAGYSVVLSLAS